MKLFRATSDIRYWNLLHATAHHLTQYLSTKKRPIHAFDGSPMPEGWMNERVNLSDWEGKDRVGEIFYGTCWCETSLLLTICELPGVYICGDDLYVLDHVTVEKTDDGTVILYNPTDYDCTVTILKESKEEARRALKPDYMKQCIRVRIGKGEKVSLGR